MITKNQVSVHFNKMVGDVSPTKTISRINDILEYLQKWNIDNVVVGVSGGIDSAFVLAMLVEAQKQVPITIHTLFFKHGLHDNEANVSDVYELINNFGLTDTFSEVDISPIITATNNVTESLGAVVDTQYAYALMYTLLFRKAQEVGGITFGTTNKDEFSIGWFGKTSDMVVDIQPIHDFHKFEIYNSWLCESIPNSIVNKSPNGDILCGLSDEDVFGCSYNEVAAIVDLYESGMVGYDDLQENYTKLYDLICSNKHKLVKPKNEYNPIFL